MLLVFMFNFLDQENIATVLVHLAVFVVSGATSSTNLQLRLSNQIGIRFGRTVALQVSTHGWIFDLTSQFEDGGHDVISRRKVLPPGA